MKFNAVQRLLINIALVAMLFFLISFGFFYKVLPLITNKDRIVAVPNVNGLTLAEAMETLEQVQLGFEVKDSSYNLQLPPFTVLQQFPAPSANVKVNRKIHLVLNAKQPPKVRYPDLTGSTFDFAKKQIQDLDLKIGEIQYKADIAENSVLESKVNGRLISTGELLPKGSVIDLTIGKNADELKREK